MTREGHITIFGKRAWRIEKMHEGNVTIRRMAGPDNEPPTLTIPESLLAGRPLYKRVSEIDTLDLDEAVATVRESVDPNTLGASPRAWAQAFAERYAGREVPDATIMLGWFANAMSQQTAADAAAAAEKSVVARSIRRKADKTRNRSKTTAREPSRKAKPRARPVKRRSKGDHK
jgi:hypothetical protein